MRFPKADSTNSATNVRTLDLEECLAKTHQNSEGSMERGCSVTSHLMASWRVAKQLQKFYASFEDRPLFQDSDLIAPLLHDIGKLTPAFQDRIHSACESWDSLLPGIHREAENHCVASYLTLKALNFPHLARLAAAHHGSYCNPATNSLSSCWTGGTGWQQLRERTVKDLCARLNLPLTDVSAEESKQSLLLGLTILADWLSSGMDPAFGEEVTDAQAANAVRKAGFIPFHCRQSLAFGDVFQSAAGVPFPPHPIQRIMGEVVKPGGVYVLETEMGGGKTEAALYLAYRLLAEHRHSGIYFALPTQLTSDKIYERFQPFLKKILADEDAQTRRTLLLHGKAWLRRDLGRQSDANGFQTPESAEAGTASDADDWFDSRKRGLLAPFAVGTIDQALMAVINVRHGALRALGLAGKVVILDEVHSYDAYTGTLLKELVQKLRCWGCTVILLSATLTKELRNELLGLASEAASDSISEASTSSEICDSYPLLSIQDAQGQISYETVPTKPADEKRVQIRHSFSVEDSLGSALERARRGECVLWIENTVRDAQKIFRRLAACLPPGVKIGLIHSRFPTCLRRRNEKTWTALYGKDVTAAERAGGKILVGTQVLEQSVDLDADYLITRLCPTDMLFQRVGRLWRHPGLNSFRPKSAECAVEVLSEISLGNREKWSQYESVPSVYATYVLARTQELLEGRDSLSIPGDLRELIEKTYEEREETGYWGHLKQQLMEEKQKLTRFACLSSGDAMKTQRDVEGATTRYSEEETVDVLLLEAWDAQSRMMKLPGFDAFRFPAPPVSVSEKLLFAKALTPFLIRVRASAAPRPEGFPAHFLSHIFYVGKHDDHPLRVAFLSPEGRLLDQSGNPARAERDEYDLFYDEMTGYSYEKKGGKE